MKKTLLSVIFLGFAFGAFAQSLLVATLTHNDSIQNFYGTDAFREAHNAAVHGDIISLSGGAFYATDINKAISVRGAGADVTNPTVLLYNLKVNIPAGVTQRLQMEGCVFRDRIELNSASNAYFLKDDIASIYAPSTLSNLTGNFVQCKINDFLSFGSCNLQFVNCYLNPINIGINNIVGTTNILFNNCVIMYPDAWIFDLSYFGSTILVNTILCGKFETSADHTLPYSSTAINCITIGENASTALQTGGSVVGCTTAQLNIFIDSNPYNDLTETAKATYLGNDDTPVGMYGGFMPFNLTPSYPIITKLNVAKRATADGKLSVEIEVNAAQ